MDPAEGLTSSVVEAASCAAVDAAACSRTSAAVPGADTAPCGKMAVEEEEKSIGDVGAYTVH